MNKFLSIHEITKYLGVSPQTLRCWEKKIIKSPLFIVLPQVQEGAMPSNQLHPFDLSSKFPDRPTITHARASSHDQKDDLQRQIHLLKIYPFAKV